MSLPLLDGRMAIAMAAAAATNNDQVIMIVIGYCWAQWVKINFEAKDWKRGIVYNMDWKVTGYASTCSNYIVILKKVLKSCCSKMCRWSLLAVDS